MKPKLFIPLLVLTVLPGCAFVRTTVDAQGNDVLKVQAPTLDDAREKMKSYCGGKFHSWGTNFSSSKGFVYSSSCSGSGCTALGMPTNSHTVTLNFACGGSVYEGLTEGQKEEFRKGVSMMQTLGVIPDSSNWISKYGKFLRPVEPIQQ